MAKRILKAPPAARTLTPMEQEALRQRQQEQAETAAEPAQGAQSPGDDIYQGFAENPPERGAEPPEWSDAHANTGSLPVPEHVKAIPGMAEALEVAQLAEVEQTAEDEEDAAADNPPDESASADIDDSAPPAACPWCGNAHNQTPPDVTDDDKIKFIATIRGPTRFVKTYDLFGGELAVTFRTRTPWETNQILKQLNMDVSAGELLTAADYAQRLTDYQLCAEIQSLIRPDAVPLQFLPLRDIDYDKETYTTPLPQLYQYIFDEVLQTEAVRQAVGQSWLDFTARFNHMLARKDDPDFFTATRSAG